MKIMVANSKMKYNSTAMRAIMKNLALHDVLYFVDVWQSTFRM